MKTIIAAAIAATIAILPAAAQPKADPTPVPAATVGGVVQKPIAGKRYCYDTEMTGTRLTKRVCHTRAEWKELGVKVPDGL